MSDAKLTVAADISALTAEMQKIPGVTADAALKAATELKKQQDAIARQAEATAKRIQAAADKAAGDMEGKVAGSFQAVNKTATVIAPALQGITGPLDDMGDLIEKVGFKGAAAMVGVGALAAGLIALAGNAVDVAMRVDEISEEIGASSPLMVRYRDDLEDARDSVESAGFALADMRTELAGRWAPTVEAGASVGVSFAAVMGEIGSDVGVATSYIASSVGALIDQGGAISGALSIWVDYGEEIQTQARLQRELADAQREVEAALKVTTREIELQAEALLGAQLAALGMVETQEQEQERIRKQTEAEQERDKARAKAEREREKAARELEAADERRAKAADELYATLQGHWVREMDAEDQIIARRDIDIAKIMELADASKNYVTAEEAIQARMRQAEQETADLRAKLAEEQQRRILANQLAAERASEAERAAAAAAATEIKKGNQQSAQARDQAWVDSIGVAQQATDSILGLLDMQHEGNRKAAYAIFAVQKALALADIGVKTSQSVMSALTIPPPAGEVFAVANVAAGVAAAAAVAAQQPTFHDGRLNQSRGLATDETRAVIKGGEVILSRPMVDRAGGPDGVRNLMDGGGSGSPVFLVDFGARRVVAPLVEMTARMGYVDPMTGWSHG